MIIKVNFITNMSQCVNNIKYENTMKKSDGTTSNISPIILFSLLPVGAFASLMVIPMPSSTHPHRLYNTISALTSP